MNFFGALAFNKVAQTVAGNIINPQLLQYNVKIIIPALLAAIIWNLITWFFGLPNSSAHTLIGALVGAFISTIGPTAINYEGLIIILKSLFFSPLIAFLTGFSLMNLCRVIIFFLWPNEPNKYFIWLQRFSVIGQAFAHGTNDAQKTIGIIVLSLAAENCLPSPQTYWEIKIAVASALALGTAMGGWRIINTISKKITKLEPANGFIADLSSVLVILGATFFGLPVSTTHVVSMAIIGTGIAKSFTMVNWPTVLKLILAWGATLPVTVILGATFSNLFLFFANS